MRRVRRPPVPRLAAAVRLRPAADARQVGVFAIRGFATAAIPPDARSRTESLRDLRARLRPYWYDVILPALLVKHRDCVGEEASALLSRQVGRSRSRGLAEGDGERLW